MAALTNLVIDDWSFSSYFNSLDEVELDFIDCIETDNTEKAEVLLQSNNPILQASLINVIGKTASKIFQCSYASPESSSPDQSGHYIIHFTEANILHISILKGAVGVISKIVHYLPELAIQACIHKPGDKRMLSFSALQLAVYTQYPTALQIFQSLLPHDPVRLKNMLKRDFNTKCAITHPSQLHLLHTLAETCDIDKTTALFEHIFVTDKQPGVSSFLGSKIKNRLMNLPSLPDMPDVIADLIVDYTTFKVNETIINAANYFVPMCRFQEYKGIDKLRPFYFWSNKTLPFSFMSSPKLILGRNSKVSTTDETVNVEKMILQPLRGDPPALLYRLSPTHTVAMSNKPDGEKIKMLQLLSSSGANFGCIEFLHPEKLSIRSPLLYSKGLADLAPDLFKTLNELGPHTTLKFDLSLPTTFKNMVIKFDIFLSDRIQRLAQQIIETTAKKISEMLDD